MKTGDRIRRSFSHIGEVEMKYIERYARWLGFIASVWGGIQLAGFTGKPGERVWLILAILLWGWLWMVPLFIQRQALLELGERGYKVSRSEPGRYNPGSWDLSGKGYSTSASTIAELLEKATDYDYRLEIVDEYKKDHDMI